MSYRRSFSKQLDIPISVELRSPSYRTDGEGKLTGTSSGSAVITINGRRYSYSIGTSGGTWTDHGTHYETVDINVEVDTDPFDHSVASCNDKVNLLTGSVVATEAAQVESIDANSKKVAKTVITGFFKNVQADISGKILELSQRVDSRLMHLREQAKTLRDKQMQMEADYQRTKARYAKIFDDLNIALEDRVKALDLPVFKMVSTIEEESDRMINADFAEIASVIAKENTELSAQIGVAMSKKRAKEAIARATEFLRIHRQTDRAIQRSTISEAEARNGGIFLPVCFYETTEAGGVVNRDCSYDKEHLPQTVSSVVDNEILSNPDKVVSMHPVERENIEKYFNASIQQAMQQSTSPHDTRVINTINKLFYEK